MDFRKFQRETDVFYNYFYERLIQLNKDVRMNVIGEIMQAINFDDDDL